MKFKTKTLSLVMAGLISTLSFSNAVAQENNLSIEDKVRSQHAQLKEAPINVTINLSELGLKGLHAISIGGQSMIVDDTGRYAIIGDLYDLNQMINISEQERTKQMSAKASAVIPKIKESEMVIFSPNKNVENIGTLYVFTDPTCGFCQRLHHEIEQYQSAGVTVKYIPYPRSGYTNNGQDYIELKKIVCSTNPQDAMTDFKNRTAGTKYDNYGSEQKCHDIVEAGYKYGQEVGLSGTPFLYLSTGKVIPGYNSASVVIDSFKNKE